MATTEAAADALRNRASSSSSPYIRRHADSPVAWQPLCQQSLDRAARENKLVFLNIGSAPCHYAQLMTQDSWSRPAVADILNQHYVPVMVDRDERPDLDSIYAHYLMSIHGKAGYPMNLFLTSSLRPVYGDTYLEGPTDNEYDEVGEDNPDILFILKRVEKHWREERERLLAEGDATFTQLQEILAEGTRSQPSAPTREGAIPEVDIELEIMEEAYTGHAKLYDPVNAGFLSVPTDPSMPAIIPKFSMVSRLDYLLRLSHLPSAVKGVVGDTECDNAKRMTLDTLRKMRDLTMQDQLGGGFHTSTQTRDWAFPLFEKVAGHNGQLLDLYLDAWLTTSSPSDRRDADVPNIWRSKKNEFLDVVISLANYLTKPPICKSTGGFCISEAADSPSRAAGPLRSGAFYVWSKKDFLSAVEGAANGELAASFFNVKSGGNIDKVLDPRDEFILENVLSIAGNEESLAGRHGSTASDARKELAKAKEALRKWRETHRPRPATDSRIIAGENGKIISALSRAGAALGTLDKELGNKCLSAASAAAAFIKAKMWDPTEKVLYRIADGEERQRDTRGFAEDYAFLIDGLIYLYEATGGVTSLMWADELQRSQIKLFLDPRQPVTNPPSSSTAHCGGFFSTEISSSHTIIRAKGAMDDVSPSVNGVSASNLFRLGALLGDDTYTRLAKETILAFEVEMPVHPGLFTSLLVNLVTAKMGGKAYVVAAPGMTRGVPSGHGSNNVNNVDGTGSHGHGGGTPPAAKAGDLKERLFSTPRAGLRTLVQLPVEEADRTWLVERNSKLSKLLQENGFDPEVAYVLDEKEKKYRPFTAAELRRLSG